MPSVDALYDVIQDVCLPGLWSKGVALARAGSVIQESTSDDEIVVRVQIKDRPLSPKVQLWPQDEDWFCDCGDKGDACAHAAAAVIAVKNGQVVARGESGPGARPSAPYLRYRFRRVPEGLSFDRFIVNGDKEEILHGSLISHIGGVGSGRISSRAVLTSKEDFAVDGALLVKKRGIFDVATMRQLLSALKDCSNIMLDDKEIHVSSVPVGSLIAITDDGPGFRIEVSGDQSVTETFKNGAALCGDLLKPLTDVRVQPRRLSRHEAIAFVSETLPELEKKSPVDIRTQRLPKLDPELRARMVLQLEELDDGSLSVVPRLVYGDPALVEVRGDELDLLKGNAVPRRDRGFEHQLIRKLQTELHLALGRVTKFNGEGAVTFRLALKGWDIEGTGAKRFDVSGTLVPRLSLDGRSFGVTFELGESGGGQASPDSVFRAWRDGASYVRLVDGGFASLPQGWLTKNGETIASLLAARDEKGKLPSYLLPRLAVESEQLGLTLPDPLKNLRRALETFEGIPNAKLPRDLKAELRSYQVSGVNWLCFLRDSEMGAMLADDMGLGKTVQALCALKGRTLIVAPTSVVHSWAEQIEMFRPQLSYSIYHGGGRQLDNSTDVVLTTYSILRLDRDRLTAIEWDTIVLDEAQTIKNPESQVAAAAHDLRGKFKIALTGTPIENRLDDLWSQFQFLNPGLLGHRTTFGETLSRDPKLLRQRIRPFVLRRLKRDVAPELPPRTEVVLQCELSQDERAVYESVLAATRSEIVAQVSSQTNVMQLLEAILRLRQASCHTGLLPGQKAASSSKVELLLETLQESIALGHRALIFSQWTSYLDLIEPCLEAEGIAFTRLDGTTTNRQEVVAGFQREDGPPVMLLSLKAGGVGLNLTAADHVFLLDPWWNPAVEDQAADRAHRIGQKNPVIVHRLIAKDTVEERILLLQKSKLELAGAVLEDAAGAAQLTKDDLLRLLEL